MIRSRKCIARPETEAVMLYSDGKNEMMEVHVLWSPERGPCNQCGVVHEHVRRFSAQGCCTMFCAQCWDGFVDDECNVSPGQWRRDVAGSWNDNIALCLEYEDGTSQGSLWN
jgi:hypothetical protein